MNANELADDLEGWSDTPLSINHKDNVFKEHANMLRQQHAEIELLTDQYQRLNENLEMWKDGHFKQQAEIEALKNRNWDLVSEPWGFDRHPAKTLTDEEIIKVYEDMLGVASARSSAIDFAKAILKKAQENNVSK